ncbi:MAG: nucleoside hydrolase [Bacteroidota bacterium]|nr:nucleoside hydrolase [Bacteroidota bacterium]MDP4192005.1 nucleoside hydrolase [Bacteroidota bacterium]MDP4195777.1 nucleoside hydrolase [Bacteroidota bacterium]
MYKILFLVIMFAVSQSSFTQEFATRQTTTIQGNPTQKNPIPVIFDSDMGPDYDDVGAIAILHALADSGYAKVLATCASTKYEGVAAVLNTFNSYFNRSLLPVGIPKGDALEIKDWQHWTDTILSKYPHRIKKNVEAMDAALLYRSILAKQPDHSVVFITVGFLTNLANLLDSKGDQYSKLPGRDLVRNKVKQLVCMAGRFPYGREFNVFSDSVSSFYVFKNWPTPIIFDGFEIGVKIKTGLPLIKNNDIKNSPVKDVFSLCIPKSKGDSLGRMSWDEIAVLVAIKGCKPWFNLHKGKIIIKQDGSNSWNEKGTKHFYLQMAQPINKIEEVINKLLMCRPRSSI